MCQYRVYLCPTNLEITRHVRTLLRRNARTSRWQQPRARFVSTFLWERRGQGDRPSPSPLPPKTSFASATVVAVSISFFFPPFLCVDALAQAGMVACELLVCLMVIDLLPLPIHPQTGQVDASNTAHPVATIIQPSVRTDILRALWSAGRATKSKVLPRTGLQHRQVKAEH